MSEPKKRRPLLRWAAFVFVLAVGALGANQALFYPDTPLPEEWNPTAPFEIAHAPSPLTDWKIAGLIARPGACQEVLANAARFTPLPPLEASENCGIAQRVSLAGVGDASTRAFETTCEIALRMALWEEHGLQPAAREFLGQGVREIRHYSSYNCRRMRTSSGESNRWSTHSRARAVDVSGFVLDDGRLVDLKRDWEGEGANSAFLRRAQETACDVFGLVLGPEYNALHADHFHIQLDWQGCR